MCIIRSTKVHPHIKTPLLTSPPTSARKHRVPFHARTRNSLTSFGQGADQSSADGSVVLRMDEEEHRLKSIEQYDNSPHT